MPQPHKLTRYYDIKHDERGQRYIEVQVTGFPLLQIPLLNKSTAFSPQERRELGIEGWAAPFVWTNLNRGPAQGEYTVLGIAS